MKNRILQLFLLFQAISSEISPKDIQAVINDREIVHKASNIQNFKSTIINPIFGYLAKITGTIEKLRLFGPETTFSRDDTNSRVYVKDKSDDPIVKLLIKLFPSSSGNLNHFSGATSNFARNFCDDLSAYDNQQSSNDKNILPGPIEFLSDMFIFVLRCNYNTTSGKPQYNAKSLNSNFDDVKKIIIRGEKSKTFGDNTKLLTLLSIQAFATSVFCKNEHLKMYLSAITEQIKDTDVEELSKLTFEYSGNTAFLEEICDIEKILELFPYSKIHRPALNEQVNVYNRSLGLFIRESFSDCVDILLLNICNCILFNPETKRYDVSHLNPDLELSKFYKKHSESFTVTPEIRRDWSKVVQCLEGFDKQFFNNGSKSCSDTDLSKYNTHLIVYHRPDNNEIKSGIINMINVLRKIFDLPNPDNFWKVQKIDKNEQKLIEKEIIQQFETFHDQVLSELKSKKFEKFPNIISISTQFSNFKKLFLEKLKDIILELQTSKDRNPGVHQESDIDIGEIMLEISTFLEQGLEKIKLDVNMDKTIANYIENIQNQLKEKFLNYLAFLETKNRLKLPFINQKILQLFDEIKPDFLKNERFSIQIENLEEFDSKNRIDYKGTFNLVFKPKNGVEIVMEVSHLSNHGSMNVTKHQIDNDRNRDYGTFKNPIISSLFSKYIELSLGTNGNILDINQNNLNENQKKRENLAFNDINQLVDHFYLQEAITFDKNKKSFLHSILNLYHSNRENKFIKNLSSTILSTINFDESDENSKKDFMPYMVLEENLAPNRFVNCFVRTAALDRQKYEKIMELWKEQLLKIDLSKILITLGQTESRNIKFIFDKFLELDKGIKDISIKVLTNTIKLDEIIENLKNFKNLEGLGIFYLNEQPSRINNQNDIKNVEIIQTKFKKLRLENIPRNSNFYSNLIALILNNKDHLNELSLRNINLESLLLKKGQLEDVLSQMKNLEIVDISGPNNFTDIEKFQSFLSFISTENNNIKDLNLSNNEVKNSKNKIFSNERNDSPAAYLKKFKKLEKLNLSKNELDNQNFIHFEEALQYNENLQELDLSYNEFSMIPFDKGQNKFEKLTKLDISDNSRLKIYTKDLEEFGARLALFPQLCELRMSKIQLFEYLSSAQNIQELLDLILGIENLAILNLSDNHLPSNTEIKFNFKNPRNIKELVLSNMNLVKDHFGNDFKSLSSLSETIEKLDISNNKISEDCVELLEKLKSFTKLKLVNISKNHIPINQKNDLVLKIDEMKKQNKSRVIVFNSLNEIFEAENYDPNKSESFSDSHSNQNSFSVYTTEDDIQTKNFEDLFCPASDTFSSSANGLNISTISNRFFRSSSTQDSNDFDSEKENEFAEFGDKSVPLNSSFIDNEGSHSSENDNLLDISSIHDEE